MICICNESVVMVKMESSGILLFIFILADINMCTFRSLAKFAVIEL
jgi:hypothetical protein